MRKIILVGGALDGQTREVATPLPPVLRLHPEMEAPKISSGGMPSKHSSTLRIHTYIKQNLLIKNHQPVPKGYPFPVKDRKMVDIDYYLSAEIGEVAGIHSLFIQALEQYKSNE